MKGRVNDQNIPVGKLTRVKDSLPLPKKIKQLVEKGLKDARAGRLVEADEDYSKYLRRKKVKKGNRNFR